MSQESGDSWELSVSAVYLFVRECTELERCATYGGGHSVTMTGTASTDDILTRQNTLRRPLILCLGPML